jgi:hypothetical protein
LQGAAPLALDRYEILAVLLHSSISRRSVIRTNVSLEW